MLGVTFFMEAAGRHREDDAAAAAEEEEREEEERRGKERRGRRQKAGSRRLLETNSSPMSDSVDVLPSRLDRRKPAQVTLTTSIQHLSDRKNRKPPSIIEWPHLSLNTPTFPCLKHDFAV